MTDAHVRKPAKKVMYSWGRWGARRKEIETRETTTPHHRDCDKSGNMISGIRGDIEGLSQQGCRRILFFVGSKGNDGSLSDIIC